MTDFLIQTTVYLTVTALLILLLKRIFKSKLSAKWQVFVWAILLIRFFIPSMPESEISVFNTVKVPETVYMETTPIVFPAAQPIAEKTDVFEQTPVKANKNTGIEKITNFVWIIGAVSLFSYFIAVYVKESFKKKEPITDESIYNILSECKNNLNIPRKIRLVKGNTPMLMGIFRPKIIIPQGYSENEQRDILMHELCHLKNNDILILWLGILVLCFNWFNPIIWYSFFVLRRDIEVFCDSRVLKYCDNKKEYASLLLKTALSKNKFLAGTTALQNGEKEIARRIKYIAYFKKPKVLWSIIIAVLAIIISAICLTNAKGSMNCRMSEEKFVSFSELMIGSMMADIAYTDEERVIFYYHDGIFVYNLQEEKMEHSFDLAKLNCSPFAQGDTGLILQTDGKRILLINVGRKDVIKKLDNYIIDIKTGKAEKTTKTELENAFSEYTDSFKAIPAYNDSEIGWFSDKSIELDRKLYYLVLGDGSRLEYVKIKVLDMRNREFLEFYPFRQSFHAKVVTLLFKEYRLSHSANREILSMKISDWQENGNEAYFTFTAEYKSQEEAKKQMDTIKKVNPEKYEHLKGTGTDVFEDRYNLRAVLTDTGEITLERADKQLSLVDYMQINQKHIDKITVSTLDEQFSVDIMTFLKAANSITLKKALFTKQIGFDGMYITVEHHDGTSSFAYVSFNGEVDTYGQFMSRLPCSDYIMTKESVARLAAAARIPLP